MSRFHLTLRLLLLTTLALGAAEPPKASHEKAIPQPMAMGPGAKESSDPRTVRISSGGLGCTASILEPLSELLTAAHCFPSPDKKDSAFPVDEAALKLPGGEPIALRCRLHPGYPKGPPQVHKHDMALCRIPEEARAAIRNHLAGKRAFCLDREPPALAASLTLIGFGTPSGPPVQTKCAGTVGARSVAGLLTMRPHFQEGRPCTMYSGDSGGPIVGPTGKLVGVGSGGTWKYPQPQWQSHFAAIGDPENHRFLEAAMRETKGELCGLSTGDETPRPEDKAPKEKPPAEHETLEEETLSKHQRTPKGSAPSHRCPGARSHD